ncbi:hypothetical protein BTVI_155572 [Pitangus sulphuratus]|nr:hypothetical protein BTVI_155572 [Pitangus sulphuratus]
MSQKTKLETKLCGTEQPQIAGRCQDEEKKFISACEGKVIKEHNSWHGLGGLGSLHVRVYEFAPEVKSLKGFRAMISKVVHHQIFLL